MSGYQEPRSGSFPGPLKEALNRLLSLVINLLLPSFKFSGLQMLPPNLQSDKVCASGFWNSRWVCLGLSPIWFWQNWAKLAAIFRLFLIVWWKFCSICILCPFLGGSVWPTWRRLREEQQGRERFYGTNCALTFSRVLTPFFFYRVFLETLNCSGYLLE